MQTKFSKWVAAVFAGVFVAPVASAHPGHAPLDAAMALQPFAGPEHFVAFMALTSVLLVTLRCVLKAREARKTKRQAPTRRA